MNIEKQSSFHLGCKITCDHQLTHQRVYYQKFCKQIIFNPSFNYKKNNEWVRFLRRLKILNRIVWKSKPNFVDEEFYISNQILSMVSKNQKGLKATVLPFDMTKKQIDPNQYVLMKKILSQPKSMKEAFLIFGGPHKNYLGPLIAKSQSMRTIEKYRLNFTCLANEEFHSPEGIRKLYKIAERSPKMTSLDISLFLPKISDHTIQELYQFKHLEHKFKEYKLNCPYTVLDDSVDDDNWSSFSQMTEQQSHNKLEHFESISLMKENIQQLELYLPLKEIQEDGFKSVFNPLGELINLQKFHFALPNLELKQADVKHLTNALIKLEKIRDIDLLLSFGMISQEEMNRYFDTIKKVDMEHIRMHMTFSSQVDFSNLYKSFSLCNKLVSVNTKLSHLANIQFDSSLCDMFKNCKSLESFQCEMNPLVQNVFPDRKTFTCCFCMLMETIAYAPKLRSLKMKNPKLGAENNTISALAKCLGSLDDIEILRFDISYKNASIDYEIGHRFWEAIVSRPKLKVINISTVFGSGEALMNDIRPHINEMKNFRELGVMFECQNSYYDSLYTFLKRFRDNYSMKNLSLSLNVKQLVTHQQIEKVQNTLKQLNRLESARIAISNGSEDQVIKINRERMFDPTGDFFHLE